MALVAIRPRHRIPDENERQTASIRPDRRSQARPAGRQLRQHAGRGDAADGQGRPDLGRAGKEYVDFLLGSGPMFIGHAHPEVTAAVQSQLPHGTTFFGNNRHGIALGRGDRRCRALRRPGALRLLRHRGRSLRHARGPRLPQARQDPEVRGRLSRHERLCADVAGAQAARQLPARHSRFGRHPQERARTRCWSRPSTTSRWSRA